MVTLSQAIVKLNKVYPKQQVLSSILLNIMTNNFIDFISRFDPGMHISLFGHNTVMSVKGTDFAGLESIF